MHSTISHPALEIDDLAFSYGKRFALNNVSFAIRPGDFTVLLGPNGAGKTTLFAIITHLFESAHGAVRVCGWDIRTEPRRALACMGVVFQQPTLDLDLTVLQNLRYFAALQGKTRRTADSRIELELERLALEEFRHQKIRQLSGGYRRRVEVARALLHEPALLLLDEPTVGLDVPARERIVDHVHKLSSANGIAVLWATHLIDEIRTDDRVVVMHSGQIKAQGSAAEVTRSAAATSIGEAFSRLIDTPSS
jgi:ABC-2 type transport system ATP-binding protein